MMLLIWKKGLKKLYISIIIVTIIIVVIINFNQKVDQNSFCKIYFPTWLFLL